MQYLKGCDRSTINRATLLYVETRQTLTTFKETTLKHLIFLNLLLSASLALGKPAPRDRYEEYDEPCQDEYDPYLECKYNMKSYFPSCWEMSRTSRSPSDDFKAVNCFLERLSGLMEKDPLKYQPLEGDPHGASGISEYRKTEAYAKRLKDLGKHLEYLPSAPFCLYSHTPTHYERGAISFSVRGLRFANAPNKKLKASKVQGAVYNGARKGHVPLAYFFVREGVLLLEFLSLCKGGSCPFFFSVSAEGEVY